MNKEIIAQQKFIAECISSVPVIPVLVIEDVNKAAKLAEVLVSAGLHVLEVTLRTQAALDVVKAMSEVPGAIIGVGTLMTEDDVLKSKKVGAKFGVSPGSTKTVLDACEKASLPLLPGIDNVTCAMENLERGYHYQKFFPAEQSGGAQKLKALYSPLPQIKFCPTGGVSLANAAQYLDLPNVCCVGGSWVTPKSAIEAEDWDEITNLALQASRLNRS